MNHIKTIYEALHPMSKGAFARALGIGKSKCDRLMAGEEPHPNLLARAKKMPTHPFAVQRILNKHPELCKIEREIWKFAEMVRNDYQYMEDFEFIQSLHAAYPELYDISCEMWFLALTPQKD